MRLRWAGRGYHFEEPLTLQPVTVDATLSLGGLPSAWARERELPVTLMLRIGGDDAIPMTGVLSLRFRRREISLRASGKRGEDGVTLVGRAEFFPLAPVRSLTTLPLRLVDENGEHVFACDVILSKCQSH